MKIILLNAPPNSGKDFASDYLHKQYNTFQFSFKRKLIELVKLIYSLSDDDAEYLSDRKMKSTPCDLLQGRSWRDALIFVSESVIKKNYGSNYFGKQELNNILLNCCSDIAVSSDCGFVEEVSPLVAAFGGENIFVVHIEAEGCSFDGDSRNYVYHNSIPDENYITIFNKKNDEFYDDLDWLYAFISKSL